MPSQIASIMGVNSNLAYLNQDGKIALIVSIGDGSGAVTRFNSPDGSINNGPGPFLLAPTNVTYLLYADGNIKQYEDSHADGSDINIQFADTGPITAFGLNSNYTVGPMTVEVKTTAAGVVTTETFAQSFDAPGKEVTHLVQYNLASATNSHLLVGSFDPATHISTLSLLDDTHLTPLTNTGFGTIDNLVGNDGSSLVGNDGSSLISKNGVILVGNDGSSLISGTLGIALVGNDGSSLALKAGVSLVGNDGSSLVGNDGSSLRIALLAGDAVVSNDGATLISNAGSSLIPNAGLALISQDGAGLVGNDGSSLVGDNGASLIRGGGNLLNQNAASLISSNPSLLLGKDGASVVANDGATLVGDNGAGIYQRPSGAFGGVQSSAGAGPTAELRDIGAGLPQDGNTFFSTNSPHYTALPSTPDVAGSTATTSTLALGDSATGTLEKIGDRDWFAVSLTAGHIYQIDLKGAATGDGTLGDPWLRLFDSGGLPVAQIDDGGVGNNSQLIYTALASGTYYAEASGRGDLEIGTYALSLAEAPQTITLNPVAGDNILSAGEQAADSAAGLVVSGTTSGIAAGHALTVALNGHNYAAAVAGDGTWQTTIAPADVVKLAAGSHQVSVSADGTTDHATENFLVAATIHTVGNTFMQPDFQSGPIWTPVTAVLANGTFVAANDPLFSQSHSFQLFNSSGTAISPEIAPFVPAGIVDTMEIVPASVGGGGGFAIVFGVRPSGGGNESWFSDFFDSNGVSLQTNIQLPLPADPQAALGFGYQSAAATMTATPTGGYFMAENYSQSVSTVGSPSSFPGGILEIGGSFFDSAGHSISTLQVNGVLKTSIDGISYDGSNSSSGVSPGQVAALADGSVAVVYVDSQFSTDPDLKTIVHSSDISVDVVSPTGANLWIDVNADPFQFFSGPLVHNFLGNGVGIVALSATTFGVLWDEKSFNNGVTTDSMMLKTYDENGFALSGEITVVGNAKAHHFFGSPGTTPVSLGNGNFAFQYDDVANNQTVIAAVSSTGVVLDSIAFPIDPFTLYSIAAAPDGSFYVTTAPDGNSGFTTQHYALGTSFAPVTNASPVVTGSVTLAAIDENSGAHLITQAQLLGNATDADGPSLTATNLTIATGIGTLVDNHNGTWSYTPATGDSSAVSFAYQVTDGVAAPVADNATLDITPVGGPTVDTHWTASVDLGTHPAGWLPTVVGDFNNDGTSDLLWFNSSTRDAEVWKIANGQWAGSADIGTHPAGYAIAGSGDFNHDGTSDVLWYNSTSTDVDVWKISNGQWAGSTDVGPHPAGYTPAGIGDFNSDGTSDVLWYNPVTTDVDIWKISNGQWAGSAAVGTHPAGWQPAGVGDFNGDGTSDVLWYNPTTNDAEIWKISNGQWAGSTDIGTHPAGYAPVGVGDFNGDGTSDVLWFNAATSNVDLWEIANGHWAASVNLGQHPAGWQPAEIGDFNHDGTSDIMWREAATGHTETWLLGNH